MQKLTQNTLPLHHAVLINDTQSLQKLAHHPHLREQIDEFGYTALELARFLSKKECIYILSPKNKHRHITVFKKNSEQCVRLTESEFKDFFDVDYCSHLTFSDEASFLKALHNCPWMLKTSFLGEENRQQGLHFRKELINGLLADVSIRWINEDLGYGLFADKNLLSGNYIGEFTGLVRRLYRRNPNSNEYCFHYPTKWWSWQYTIIDALLNGNETRFINHSDTPNLQPLCVYERSLLRIIFITNQPIKAGIQLTYNYGNDFWKHRKKLTLIR